MAIKIGSTIVINNNRKLTNLSSDSASLSMLGSSLVLSVGGTQQDTQELDDTHTHDTRYVRGGCCTGTLNNDTSGNPYGVCEPGVDAANVKSLSGGIYYSSGTIRFAAAGSENYLNSRILYTSSNSCQVLVFSSAYANWDFGCCAFE